MVILWLFFFLHTVEFMSNRCFKLIENGKNIYIQIFMVCIHRVYGVDYEQFAWDFPAIGVMEPTKPNMHLYKLLEREKKALLDLLCNALRCMQVSNEYMERYFMMYDVWCEKEINLLPQYGM